MTNIFHWAKKKKNSVESLGQFPGLSGQYRVFCKGTLACHLFLKKIILQSEKHKLASYCYSFLYKVLKWVLVLFAEEETRKESLTSLLLNKKRTSSTFWKVWGNASCHQLNIKSSHIQIQCQKLLIQSLESKILPMYKKKALVFYFRGRKFCYR